MPVDLPCSCRVEDDGSFVIGSMCLGCLECNTVAKIHPFGRGRLR